MKKLPVTYALLFVLVIALSGCNASMPTGESDSTAVQEAATEESVPAPFADATEEPAEVAEEEPTAEAMAEAMAEATEALVEEAAPTEEPVAEAAGPIVLRQGEFRDRDASHQGSGTALLVQNGADQLLRLDNFASSDGPDLYVYLVENPNTLDAGALGATLDLGTLQSLTGTQEYAIPAGTDLAQYQGVIIFCLEFDFVFSMAPFAN